jgi:hypothetical protein
MLNGRGTAQCFIWTHFDYNRKAKKNSDGALHSLFEYLIFAENVPIWGIFESITYVMASKGGWKTTSLGKDWKIYILQLNDCMRKKNAKVNLASMVCCLLSGIPACLLSGNFEHLFFINIRVSMPC